jgi:Rad52/22 family double-strand break repair protein
MTQLLELARPFPPSYVHQSEGGRGGDYVSHAIVNQRLIMITKGFDFTVRSIVRGDVAGVEADPNGRSPRARTGTPTLTNVIVGVTASLRVTIDGEPHVVDEAGDCGDPHNWPHDGARLKDAMSDAFKRCAMRLGLGLHLWSKGQYFLFDQLEKQETDA